MNFLPVFFSLHSIGDDPSKKNLLKSSTSKRSSFNGSLPEILIDQLPTDKIVKLDKGTNLILTCAVRGNPVPNVTWYKVSCDCDNSYCFRLIDPFIYI